MNDSDLKNYEICKDCNGEGLDENGDKCITCFGVGFLREEF